MHKLLVGFFLYIVLLLTLFPQPTVYAADACQQKCTNGAPIQADGKCPATGTGNPIVFSCTDPNTHPDQSSGSCLCEAGAPAAAAPPVGGAANPGAIAPAATPCTDSKTCTQGRGLSCDPKSGSPGAGDGILTAIGCVPTKPQAFVEGILKYGTVFAGVIAFILMLLGAIGMITAEGNPEAIKKSQERFYSAIVGLLFIIFSVLLMQVIGVDVLGLPGFAR